MTRGKSCLTRSFTVRALHILILYLRLMSLTSGFQGVVNLHRLTLLTWCYPVQHPTACPLH